MQSPYTLASTPKAIETAVANMRPHPAHTPARTGFIRKMTSRFPYMASATLTVMVLLGCATSPPRSPVIEEPIVLTDRSFFPEGIAADRAGGLYIGSLMQGSILYLAPGTHAPERSSPPAATVL